MYFSAICIFPRVFPVNYIEDIVNYKREGSKLNELANMAAKDNPQRANNSKTATLSK